MSPERTPEEREAARRAREARRAARSGEAAPAPEPDARAAEPEPEPPAPEPELKPPAPAPAPEPEPPMVEPEPPMPMPEPDPPVPEPPVSGDPPNPWVDDDPDAEEERILVEDHRANGDEPSDADHGDPDHEVPLGTRRVARRPPPGGVRPAGRPPRRLRPVRFLAAGALVLVLGVLWFLVSLFQPGKGEGEGDVVVTIPRGADAGDIGDLLADRGIVSSGFFFSLRANLSDRGEDLRPGEFTLRRDMSYEAALDRLTTAPPAAPTVDLVVPEGRSIREEAAKLRAARIRGDYAVQARRTGLLPLRDYGAPPGTRDLEGFLFPATYELRRPPTARALVARQTEAFRENIARVPRAYARSRNLNVYDVLTIASMVEREAQVARERPVIAGIIYNRLRDGIPLGIDATTRYALNDWTQPLTDSDFPRSGAYDTRNRLGLPPTPIGSPGLSSIRAAARPASTPFLYYVAKPGTCGLHSFARTQAEHEVNVARYEEARAANGGRSPDTCPG